MATRDEPIRILRLIARLNVGGPALHVSYLSREFDEIGYRTTLVAGRVGGDEGSMESEAQELGVIPLYVPELQREISPFLDVAAVRRVRALIRELRPHILHTHTAKAGAVGRTAAALARPRPAVVVHTFHGHVLRGYFGPAQSAAFLQIERRLAAVSDALVAVSPEVRDDLVRLGVAPADRITVIRLGLDLDRRVAAEPGARDQVRAELGIPSEEFVVGWFGRMTEIKRADDLLRAFARLRARRGEGELVLVGDGPLAPGLRSLADELGVAPHLHFTGYRSDVGRLYAATDVVALSSANEGTPVTLIEALAASRPVVSTNVGGVVDVVEDGRSGFLVAGGDVEAFAERLSLLADEPELRASFGAHGSADVRARYSIPRLVADLDSLYRTLLEREASSERHGRRRPAALPRALPRTPRPRAPRTLRIILVSQYFPPEVGATQSRMQSFAEYLADRGHQVTVICEFPNHPQGILPEAYRGHLLEDDRANAYRILRVWVRADPEKTQRTRMAFYLSFMGLATAVGPLAGRADVVLATTPPLFTGLAGLAIARLNGAPLVLDVRDLWPAAATSLRQISPGWETAAAEALERLLYRSASLVVAVTRPFCDHIDALRADGPPTALIPNGTLEQFFLAGPPKAGDRLGVPPERYLVTFAGTMGIAQALPAVLAAAERVADVADFAFIGDGPMKQATVAEAERLRLTNVHFRPQLPVEHVPPALVASDAMLVSLSAHPTFAQFVPSKLIDFMAAGRPVLLAAAGESARILEVAGAGLVVAPEDPRALADSVRWLHGHPEEAAAMGQRGRAFAARRLRSFQAERLEQALLDITGRRNGRTS
jgi:glycosyltransferase involved in cell wall biosynthesis